MKPAVFALTALAASLPMAAQTVWTGPGNSWTVGANWSSGVPNASTVAIFDGSGPATVNLGIFQAVAADSLVFTGDNPPLITGGFYFLELTNGIGNASNGEVVLTTSGQGYLSFIDAATIMAGAGGEGSDWEAASISFEGISITNTTSLDFNGMGTTTVDSTISGNGSLTQSGTGTTYLNMANSYLGTTTVSAGRLYLGNAGAAGSNTINLNGGTLQLGFSGTLSNALNLDGGIVRADSGTRTLTGQLTGGGGFIKTGAGTIVLDSGNADYDGDTVINAGTLTLGAANSLPGGTTVYVVGGSFNTGANSQTVNRVEVSASRTMTMGGGTFTANAVTLAAGATLSGSGTLRSAVSGEAGSSIAPTGAMTIGTSDIDNPLSAFNGTLRVGANTVTLRSRTTNTLTASVEMDGGTLDGNQNFDFRNSVAGFGRVARRATMGAGSSLAVDVDQVMVFDQGLVGNGRDLGSTGTVEINGTYRAYNGSAIRTITVPTLDLSNSVLQIDLVNGSTSVLFNNLGSVDLTGATLNIVLHPDFTTVEQSWQLFSNEATVTGAFSIVNLPTGFPEGVTLTFDSVTNVLTMVPEPSTYALFGGLLGLGLAVARRRKSTQSAA